MKKIIIILAFLTLFTKINAQTWVNIPDANFRAHLQSIIPSAMSGSSLNITSTLVTMGTQTINVSGLNITDISGIQYFSSLIHLNCSNNSGLSLLPTLSNSLQYLNCSGDFLHSLPNLPTTLQYLDCSYNSITGGILPTLPNSLQYLACSVASLYGNFQSLPNNLKTLICNNNGISNLPNLPNTLQILNCFSNHIACFPNFPNSITSITITGNYNFCLPNYVLPAMNNYTSTPLCLAGNINGCAIAGLEDNILNYVGFKIYPNPTDKILNVELEISNGDNNYLAIITNNLGQIVLKEEIYFIDKNSNINVNILPNGIYLLKLKGKNSSTITKKFIITH